MSLPDLPAAYRRVSADPAVIVADGQNVTVTIRNGQLKVTDGVSSQRRERLIARAPKTISRLIILGQTGYITLEAFRWCADEGIAISQIDNEGRILATAPGQNDNYTLHQAQLLASIETPASKVALRIAQRIMTGKLAGQADIASKMLGREDIAEKINTQITLMQSATTLHSVQGYEGIAASHYWSAWSGRVTVPFSPADMLKVPAHWRSFTQRVSAPGAIDPCNAMLNYAYRLAETEARQACHMNGLDPGLSVLHAARDGRDSMALDLMEVIRPECDRIVLELLDYGRGIPYDARGKPRYFPANWVFESRHGVTRLFPPLTHALAEHSLRLAELVAPATADVVRLLLTHKHGATTVKQRTAPADRHLQRYGPPRKSGRPFTDRQTARPACAADVISDEQWRIICRHVPPPVSTGSRGGGGRRIDDRIIIAGLVWCAANNLPVKRVPREIGTTSAPIYERRSQWMDAGAWPHIVRAITRTVLPGYTGD